MIGREKRVLLRHYLEQGLSKAARWRDWPASADGRCIAGLRRGNWTGSWTRSGSGTDRGSPGLRSLIPTRGSLRSAWKRIRS